MTRVWGGLVNITGKFWWAAGEWEGEDRRERDVTRWVRGDLRAPSEVGVAGRALLSELEREVEGGSFAAK